MSTITKLNRIVSQQLPKAKTSTTVTSLLKPNNNRLFVARYASSISPRQEEEVTFTRKPLGPPANYKYDDEKPKTATPATAAVIKTPEIPANIQALIHQDYNVFDEDAQTMISKIKSIQAAMEFGHARDTFYAHLVGTFGLLGAWGQPEVVRRAGLLHTAYSGDLFQFYIFKGEDEDDRNKVRDIIGEKSEALAWLFGTVNRGRLCGFGDVVNRSMERALPLETPTVIEHRLKGTHEMSVQDTANILMVTIADYLDQMVDMNAWRDHHQIESPDVLYPGDGKPAVALYWITTVAQTIAPHLEVVPKIFNNCTEVITYENELKARDLYWKVIVHEATLDVKEQISLLEESIALNPFVGEPHIMLAQLYHRQGDFELAAQEAAQALEKMYVLATAWDKRRSFECWVGFTRVVLMRSQRAAQGLEQFPMDKSIPPSAQGRPLIHINDMLNEMKP
mmetsp:Transcript_18361/g.25897  ORF Transcript_18361/g.25897 Transcript_18361/m.25897 type:complete len:451 (+) Transcript_18361:467-1819(+)